MTIERFDSARIRDTFGVSKLPRPIAAARSGDFYPTEYRGSGRREPVLVTIDLNDAGTVERVEAILPPPPPPNVKVQAILVGPGGEQSVMHGGARALDPLFTQAAEASVRAMQFAPAELDGTPVPFRGLRMTLVFADPESPPA
jgi:hypothetical protein